MAEIIEIEGGVARLVTKTVVRQVPTSELLSLVEKVIPVTLPTIAKTQVFAYYLEDSRNNQRKMYVLCELPPARRAITKYLKRRSPRRMMRYRLAFPWTYFWFVCTAPLNTGSNTYDWSITSSRVYFAKDEYKDATSIFIPAILPNLSSNGEVCWGTTGSGMHQSLAKQIDQRVNNWYLSEFNDDLDSNNPLPYGEPNLKRWVDESANSLTAWQSWPEFNMPNRQLTVMKLIENAGEVVPVVERFRGSEFIPEIPLPMTYGRWEEWWQAIPPEQRRFGLRALENLREDDPANVPEETIIADTSGEIDDGGVPV